MSQALGEMLVASGAVSETALREALAYQRNGGMRLGEALIKLGHIDEKSLTRVLAKHHSMPFVDLTKGRVSDELIARIPEDFIREQGILPVADRAGKLIIAIDDQLKSIVVDQLQFMLGCEVGCALAAPDALKRAIRQYTGESTEEALAESMQADGGDGEEGSDAPIIRLVTRLFNDALAARASDIHVEPSPSKLRVRFRVDGMLRDVAEHPPHLHGPLLSRLKIMARMDIAEKRKPQDGRIELKIKGSDVDVRASILPSNHGESIVMRLLDRSSSLIGLRDLGFDDEDHAWFKRLIARPNGIILVTGPTGSGKTTTLYAALSELNRPDVKIITAEDPVEYHLSGLNQVQVQPRIGLTFGRVLKAMLRAAPNIILVGEIRDLETAEIAIQASLTGHLVFSTLHTNDAPSALTRLQDMGVKPFLVSAAVQGVMAQRLVRRLCSECAESYAPSEIEVRALGLDPHVIGSVQFKRARGCPVCDGQGYRGRLGIFERLQMDEDLRELTFQGAGLQELRARAVSTGVLHTLINDGARKVLAGETSVTEILRVSRSADETGGIEE